MEFPFIVVAYTSTSQGDAVIERTVVRNELELQSFKERYAKQKFKFEEIQAQPLTGGIRQQIITTIKERVEINDAVGVMATIKSLMGSAYPVYAPEIQSIAAAITKSKNYVSRMQGNEAYISINPDKHKSTWEMFNNIGTPIIALVALLLSGYATFKTPNGRKPEEKITQEPPQKVQQLDSIQQIQQKQINYLLKELAQKDAVISDSAKKKF
jgi:hypothetical protein